tara:strand:- start:51 stop:545 length:495 start_codon:yes stop_codon:yes gene_type:complete
MSELRTNRIVPRDGLPSGSSGGIIQVKMGVTTTQSTTTSGNFDATNLEVTITPTRSDSKIFLMVSGGMNGPATSSGYNQIGYKIYRSVGGASFAETESSSTGQAVFFGSANEYNPLSINFLDSPSTTSSITYKLYQKRISGSSTASVNRNSDNQTQMIAMEVSG